MRTEIRVDLATVIAKAPLRALADVTLRCDEGAITIRRCVAQVLIENHLVSKANRYIECSRYGVRLQCKGKGSENWSTRVETEIR